MNRLWAPWRMKYITGESGKSSGCVFCEAARTTDDAGRLVVCRTPHTMTIMNLFPYTNGHMMVIPLRHIASLSDLTDEENIEMMRGASTAVEVLCEAFRCDGNNLGMNLGRAAGAGIDTHLHMHVVPRWNGDTNYMAVIDDTRVISEAIEASYGKIRAVYRNRGLISD